MLTNDQLAAVKATIPLLEAGGEALTTHFYSTMLAEQPSLRPLFSEAHQAAGSQPRALARGVLIYARHIDRLDALGPLAGQIASRHVSLQVLPEHYPLVGDYLLRAIREVLGDAVATDAVIEAWGAAYRQLADLLIGAERRIYDAAAEAPGGWRGTRPFRIVRKMAESAAITSFYLEPWDGAPIADFAPGQHLGLCLRIDGQEIRRRYSLSAAANGRFYRISVTRVMDGVASRFLHDRVAEGDVLEVLPPTGSFTLQPGNRPIVLISGGVGITPVLAMAEAALAEGGRNVVFIHYARHAYVRAFAHVLNGWTVRYPQLWAHLVYEQRTRNVGFEPDAWGRPTLEQLERWLPSSRDCDVYFVGPQPFMAFIRRSLRRIGVADDRLHCEFFGPAEPLD
jgi:nitric oxide dioxygenase